MSTIAPITIGTSVFTQERLEALFDTHPTIDTFYFTVDGIAFANEDAAQAHAGRFKNKGVVTINRADIGLLPLDYVADLDANTYVPTSVALQSLYAYFLETQGGNDANAGIVPVVQAPVIVAPGDTTAEVEKPVILEPTISGDNTEGAAVSEVSDTTDEIPEETAPITEEPVTNIGGATA